MSFDRYAWQSALMSADLHPNVKLMGLVLATHANNESGKCWPAHPTLVTETSLSVSSVRRATRGLQAAGFVSFEVSPGRGKSTVYTLTIPLKGVTEKGVSEIPFKQKVSEGHLLEDEKGVSETLKGVTQNEKGVTQTPQLLRTTKELQDCADAPTTSNDEAVALSVKTISKEMIEVLDDMIESGEYLPTEPYRVVLDLVAEQGDTLNSLSKTGKGLKSVQQSIVAHAWGHFFDGKPCPFSRINAAEKLLGADWAIWIISAMTYSLGKTELEPNALASYVISTATNKKAESR